MAGPSTLQKVSIDNLSVSTTAQELKAYCETVGPIEVRIILIHVYIFIWIKIYRSDKYVSFLFIYLFILSNSTASSFSFFKGYNRFWFTCLPAGEKWVTAQKHNACFLSQTSNRNITFESQERKTLHQLNRVWFCYVLLKESCIL